MTDEREQPRYLNELQEPKRSGHDYGSDRSQGRERYERQNEERSFNPRYEDEREYTSGDNLGRERSSGASYRQPGQDSRRSSQAHYGGQGLYGQGDQGQGQFGQGPYTGYQGQYSGQNAYRSSRPEDRDQDRGGYSSSSQTYSSEGASRSRISGPRTHGPYTGKGPKGYKRSDQQMCEEANQALERDGSVDASEIEVTCNSGVLKLTGKVENRRAKRDAEECVEGIYGVSDVMNELKVENGFFANLFDTGSSSDSNDRTNASKASNKPLQRNV